MFWNGTQPTSQLSTIGSDMYIDLPIAARGRFKLIKHTGHKFDEAGNLVELGRVLEETPFQNNTFTDYGSAFILDRGSHQISVGLAGAVSFSSTTTVETSTTRSTTPDEDGMMWWRTTYRFTFAANPALSAKPVRLTRVYVSLTSSTYVWVPLGGGFIPVYGGTISICDLENSIELNRSNENIDVVWEFTEYVPSELKGTVRGWTFDGNYMASDFVTYEWTLRPANFGNSADTDRGWLPMTGRDFPGMRASLLRAGVGTIGQRTTEPSFSEVFTPEEAGVATATVTVYSNTASATYGFSATPSAGTGIDCLHFVLGHFEWQVQINPSIAKKASHKMNLSMSTSVVNRGY